MKKDYKKPTTEIEETNIVCMLATSPGNTVTGDDRGEGEGEDDLGNGSRTVFGEDF